MRAADNPGSHRFAKSKKKNTRMNPGFKPADLAKNRRNVRRLPARQFTHGR
ncbi:MAG TPA: hypothetical protein VIL71_22485 [Spirillospora sp.]|mgnify:CR=1 FL=1